MNKPEIPLSEYWPWNLAAKVVKPLGGHDEDWLAAIYVPGLIAALDSLNEKEKQLLLLRYRDYMTLEVAGNVMGIRKNWAYELESKALRKLRLPNPEKTYYWMHPEKVRELMKESKELKTHCAELEREVKDLRKGCANRPEEPEDADLPELGFSVRTYNALRRAGIYSLLQLSQQKKHKLMKLRGFGQKAYEEVKAVLSERGMELED